MKRLILLILLMAVQLKAQDPEKLIVVGPETDQWFEIVGVRVSKQPQLDGWSVGHFFKGAITYQVFTWLGAEPKHSTAVAIWGAVLYEIFVDGLRRPIFGMEPDPRGADIADICFDTLGAYCTRALNALLKLEKVNVTFSRNQLQLSMVL